MLFIKVFLEIFKYNRWKIKRLKLLNYFLLFFAPNYIFFFIWKDLVAFPSFIFLKYHLLFVCLIQLQILFIKLFKFIVSFPSFHLFRFLSLLVLLKFVHESIERINLILSKLNIDPDIFLLKEMPLLWIRCHLLTSISCTWWCFQFICKYISNFQFNRVSVQQPAPLVQLNQKALDLYEACYIQEQVTVLMILSYFWQTFKSFVLNFRLLRNQWMDVALKNYSRLKLLSSRCHY